MMASFHDPDDFLRSHERLADLVIARAPDAEQNLSAHIASTLTLVYPPERLR